MIFMLSHYKIFTLFIFELLGISSARNPVCDLEVVLWSWYLIAPIQYLKTDQSTNSAPQIVCPDLELVQKTTSRFVAEYLQWKSMEGLENREQI